MPDDSIHRGQLDAEQRFRAYLDGLPVGELAELLGQLPSRQEPLRLGVLMVALNERLPDTYKLLPPAGLPGPREGRRRSLRELVADRRAARIVGTGRVACRPPAAGRAARRARSGGRGGRAAGGRGAARPGQRPRPGRRPPGARRHAGRAG